MSQPSTTGGAHAAQAQTGILFGQIAVVAGVAVGGIWGATQWTAHALGYQPRLGTAWFALADVPVYEPWKLFEWWYWYDAYAPDVFLHGGAIAASSGLAAAAAAIGMAVWRSRMARRVTTYGSARWAEPEEIEKAGLTGDAGVFLGRLNRKARRMPNYLRHEGPEHVMAFAPTRSGKGVGLVVLEPHGWLAFTLQPLPAVQPHRCEVGGLQPAARSPPRRP